jgi:hypothetical protein
MTVNDRRRLSTERIFSHLRRGVTRFAIPREITSHMVLERKNRQAGGDSMQCRQGAFLNDCPEEEAHAMRARMEEDGVNS